jgi:hypothetical protein
MSEKSRNNAEKEKSGPFRPEPGTGPKIPGAEEQQVVIHKSPATRLVERATALRDLGIGRSPTPKSVRRRLTQGEIYSRDPEIPYVKFEAALRDIVCSLMERQDRMNEEIFYRINDLGSRLDDLEDSRQENGGMR